MPTVPTRVLCAKTRREISPAARAQARRQMVFTTGEVAKICKVAPRTVSKWFDSGLLKGYRIPGSQDRRIPRADLLRFLRENSIPSSVIKPTTNVLLVGVSQLFADRLRPCLPVSQDYRVETARTGCEVGVALVDFQPDAIVIDLSIGHGEGCGIASLVQRMAGEGDRPLVIALAGADEVRPLELAEAGFDDVYTLPVDHELIAARIRDAVRGE